jgi:hypothetical protein
MAIELRNPEVLPPLVQPAGRDGVVAVRALKAETIAKSPAAQPVGRATLAALAEFWPTKLSPLAAMAGEARNGATGAKRAETKKTTCATMKARRGPTET